MDKFNCSVTSAGVAVDFFSSIDLFDYFSCSLYTCWAPELTVSRNPSNSGYSVCYDDDPSGEKFEFFEKIVRVTMPWPLTNSGQTIFYLGYPLMEVQRQGNQSATIHASCVAIEGRGILLLGESGSGKTTVAIKLCRNADARLYANDLAIVGMDGKGLYCSGGTKFLHLRLESVSRSIPDLIRLFAESDEDSWLHKIIIEPEKLGIESGPAKCRIKSVYRVHVDETKRNLHVSSSDDMSARLNLNENLTRYIRNTTTTILGGPRFDFIGDIPSMDQPEFYRWRKEAMEIMFGDLGLLYLSGPSEKMTQFIVDQMDP